MMLVGVTVFSLMALFVLVTTALLGSDQMVQSAQSNLDTNGGINSLQFRRSFRSASRPLPRVLGSVMMI